MISTEILGEFNWQPPTESYCTRFLILAMIICARLCDDTLQYQLKQFDLGRREGDRQLYLLLEGPSLQKSTSQVPPVVHHWKTHFSKTDKVSLKISHSVSNELWHHQESSWGRHNDTSDMTKCLWINTSFLPVHQRCPHYGTLTGCCSRRGVNWSLDLSFFECVESFFSLVERESAASRRQNSEGGTLTCSLGGKVHCGWLKQASKHTGEVLHDTKSLLAWSLYVKI